VLLIAVAACGNSNSLDSTTSSSSSSSSTQYLTASTNTVWNPNAGKPLIETTTAEVLRDLSESADGYKGGIVQVYGTVESIWKKDKGSATMFQARVFASRADRSDLHSALYSEGADAIFNSAKATIDASNSGTNAFVDGNNFRCKCKVVTSFGGVISLEAISLSRD
jgi:hypothetical protein